MAHYNHFVNHKYKQIMFSSLNIGDKFRKDFFLKGRRRADIICIKTGELAFIEKRSKKEHKLYSAEVYQVSHYEETENFKNTTI